MNALRLYSLFQAKNKGKVSALTANLNDLSETPNDEGSGIVVFTCLRGILGLLSSK